MAAAGAPLTKEALVQLQSQKLEMPSLADQARTGGLMVPCCPLGEQAVSDHGDEGDAGSVHTNSTGDAGAAEAAASAVLDLSLIKRGASWRPQCDDDDDEGCATGEQTPEEGRQATGDAGTTLSAVADRLQAPSPRGGPMKRMGTGLMGRSCGAKGSMRGGGLVSPGSPTRRMGSYRAAASSRSLRASQRSSARVGGMTYSDAVPAGCAAPGVAGAAAAADEPPPCD